MRGVKLIFALVLTLVMGLSTLAGCESLFGGNDNIEGRYRFVSRTDYQLGLDHESLKKYKKSVYAKYEIGDTINENGIEHTYSADSYILDVYEDNTFFLTSVFEFPETTVPNGREYLFAYEYTWYKENREVFWTDQQEQYYFMRKNLDEPETEAYKMYGAYREKNAIIFSIRLANLEKITEIRLEKVGLDEDERLQRSIAGRYRFSTLQGVLDGEERTITAKIPYENGDDYDVFRYDTFIVVLKSDGYAQLFSRVIGFGDSLMPTVKTGTWRVENRNVVITCETNDNFFGLNEILLTVSDNTLVWTADGDFNGETSSVVLTLKK